MKNQEKWIELFSKEFKFFNKLPNDQKSQFLESASIITLNKKEIIMNEGSICKGMIFVISGSIRVYKLSEEGKEVTLYRIGMGETCILTISCILGSSNYQAIAQVEEDANVLFIPENMFKEIFAKSHIVQKFIFDTLSLRLEEVMYIVEEIAFQRKDKRIANFLLDRFEQSTDGIIRITHEEIASELGTAREVVSRLLKDFEYKGAVSLSRGKIKIISSNKLKNLF